MVKKHYGLILCACIDCGKERWVRHKEGIPVSLRCRLCEGKRLGNKRHMRGSLSSSWKGGRIFNTGGYIIIKLQPDDPFFPMVDCHGYVREHRLIMAKKLGRCLVKSELVHHKNGIRDDNREDNLALISPTNHTLRREICSQCTLRKEIRLLRWEIKEQSNQIKSLTSKLMGID